MGAKFTALNGTEGLPMPGGGCTFRLIRGKLRLFAPAGSMRPILAKMRNTPVSYEHKANT
jgi:hypothetical protein